MWLASNSSSSSLFILSSSDSSRVLRCYIPVLVELSIYSSSSTISPSSKVDISLCFLIVGIGVPGLILLILA